ncbi:subtilisin-like protein [Mycena albidolilacea]|uniref:tripeptidyl-peptidase II n=1 Tax=Mycena albidolilacea TaxID=1033008 RepID=A0AAD7ALI8_9AGAR|nr:subtilisin-like protein [Mycena albidolilacea]
MTSTLAMRPAFLLPLAAISKIGSASSTVDLGPMIVHESVAALPTAFAHVSAVSPDEEITLRIALAQSDIVGLQDRTYAVSDPANALYGQHLTTEGVAEFVRPPPAASSAVFTWLAAHGLTPTSVSPFNDILQVTLPVREANALLAADFRTFTHVASGTRSVRTLSYAVPAAMQAHIRFVHPTVAFVPPLRVPGVAVVKANHTRRSEGVERRASVAIPASCAFDTNPSCLQAVFGIPSAKANHSASNVLGVAGYIDQFANIADLTRFLANTRPDLAGSTFSVQTMDGGANDQDVFNAGIEADLDIQYTVGVASGVPVSFISVGDDSQDGISGFIDIVNSILKTPAAQRPTVLTTSYGFNEQDLPESLAVAVCNAYMQLGAVGISAIFASGDGGVGGVQPTTCTNFVPSAPGGCPFITSVGGTTNVPPHAASLFSSGGFSNYFPTPNYQAADVAAYLGSIGTLYEGLYNKSGRGFPDVSAASHNIEIVWQGSVNLVDGTSCASPIFASMIALVNDRLLAAGKPVLGFLNPFLYSTTGRTSFTDVTSGHNPGCNTDGFSATTGWDPVTGLGTPNFDGLLKAVGL